jgi:hypothetical protein
MVDNFLSTEMLTQCVAELEADRYAFEIEARGTGRIEFSLLKSKSLWRALYSKRTVALLCCAFGATVTLNKNNMLQLRRMNSETPDFPVHNDFVLGDNAIASFLYLSPGWSPKSGGWFHMYETGEQHAPTLSVAPIQNRFLAFRTEPSHWHSVERVHDWERLSVLALWDVGEIQAT